MSAFTLEEEEEGLAAGEQLSLDMPDFQTQLSELHAVVRGVVGDVQSQEVVESTKGVETPQPCEQQRPVVPAAGDSPSPGGQKEQQEHSPEEIEASQASQPVVIGQDPFLRAPQPQQLPQSGIVVHPVLKPRSGSTSIKKPLLRDRINGSLAITELSQVLTAIISNQEEISDTEAKLQVLLRRQAALMATERLLQQQKLVDVLGPDLGYSYGRPVAALLIYRCCLQWKLFVSGQSSLVGEPAPVLEAVAEVLARCADEDELALAHQDDNDNDGGRGAMLEMAHWLCVIATLLAMVDHHVPRAAADQHKTSVAAAAAQKLNEAAKKMSNTLNAFGKSMLQKMQRGGAEQQQQQQPGGAGAGGEEGHAPEEEVAAAAAAAAAEGASSPPGTSQPGHQQQQAGSGVGAPQLFRQALEVLLLKTYAACRDNTKRHLSMLLPACIQAPQPPLHAQAKQNNHHFSLEEEEEGSDPALGRVSRHSADGRGAYLKAWADLCGALGQQLALMREVHMPRILIKCLLKQAIVFINSQLFNQLLLRPEVCCTSNTAYVSAGLALLDAWLRGGNGFEDLKVLSEDLRHVRQACRFLTYRAKSSLRLDDIAAMCPALNLQQVYRLCTTSWDDAPGPGAAGHAAGGGGALHGEGANTDAATASGGGGGAGMAEDGLAANSVSGEVLEELKRRHHVSGNGGLIVTFLLEEDTTPVIAPGGVVAQELLRLVDDTALYAPLPVPPQLLTNDCPREVFEYLEADLRPADLPRPGAALVGATTGAGAAPQPPQQHSAAAAAAAAGGGGDD